MIQRIKTKGVSIFFTLKGIVERIGSVKRLDYPAADLFVYVQNLREYRTRAHSCAKEPETVEWIERFTDSHTILYDVGANIGAYSLVGAARGAQVYAFEPAFQNFFTLSKNISLNNFDKKIKAIPAAFSSKNLIDNFVYLETTSGTALGFYNQERKFHRDISHPETEKATLVFSIDTFQSLFSLPTPTMLKIDVDGGEREVLMGAVDTLRDTQLKTVLLEIDHTQDNQDELIAFVCEKGFVLESSHTRDVTTQNHIFVRS